MTTGLIEPIIDRFLAGAFAALLVYAPVSVLAAVIVKRLFIGSAPLYGAHNGERTYVAPHSVVMKGERLLPDLRYAGARTKAACGASTLGERSR